MKCKRCGSKENILERLGLCIKCARIEADRISNLPLKYHSTLGKVKDWLKR